LLVTVVTGRRYLVIRVCGSCEGRAGAARQCYLTDRWLETASRQLERASSAEIHTHGTVMCLFEQGRLCDCGARQRLTFL